MTPQENGTPLKSLTDLAHEARSDTRRWFPDNIDDLRHMAIGLAGEAGEVANLIKKADRGDWDTATQAFVRGDTFFEGPAADFRTMLAEELADVQVYILNMFAQLGVNPDVVYANKRAANERRFGKREHSSDPV